MLNVGGEPHQTEPVREGVERYTGTVETAHYPLVRVGALYAVETKVPEASGGGVQYTVFAAGCSGALAFATAILRAVEKADS